MKINERALEFSLAVIGVLGNLPYSEVLSPLRKQVIRSSTSIGANITEAQHAISKKEFLLYMHIAFRSSAETEYWITILGRTGLISKENAESLLSENSQISKILSSILVTTKKNLQS